MAKNEVFREADHLSLPVPTGTKSGQPVRVGGLNGVAETDRANAVGVKPVNDDGSRNPDYNFGGGNTDGNASVALVGAYRFDGITFAVANIGDPVYITSGNALSGTASGNSLYGHALSTKAAAAGPLTVRIAN